MNWVYVNMNWIVEFKDIAAKYLYDTMMQKSSPIGDNSETSQYILGTGDDQRESLHN